MHLSDKVGFYLDTSIWLDIYEKRGNNGEIALEFIRKIIEQEKLIGYSDLVIKEFKNLDYSYEEINQIFRIVEKKGLRRLHIHDEQFLQAIKLSKLRDVPKKDALHAILARDNNFGSSPILGKSFSG